MQIVHAVQILKRQAEAQGSDSQALTQKLLAGFEAFAEFACFV